MCRPLAPQAWREKKDRWIAARDAGVVAAAGAIVVAGIAVDVDVHVARTLRLPGFLLNVRAGDAIRRPRLCIR